MMALPMLCGRAYVRALPASALFLIVAATAMPARADRADRADNDQREEAAASYEHGIDFANRGLYAAALEQFQAAYASSPNFAVLYNIGEAQIGLGRSVDAIASLSRYLRDGADQVPLSRREQVQAQIDLLESRLAELSITTDRPGAVIRVDHSEVGRSPLFQPVRLAAGSHTVTAVWPDGLVVNRAVTLGEAERQRLDLVIAAGAASAATQPGKTVPTTVTAPLAPTATPVLVLQPAPTPQGRAARSRGIVRPAAYVLAVVGGLSVATAAGIYLHNRGRYDDWQTGSNALANATPDSVDYRQRAIANNQLASSLTTANHAIVGLSIAGAVLVAGGATLFFVDRAHSRRSGELSFTWGGGSSASLAWDVRW